MCRFSVQTLSELEPTGLRLHLLHTQFSWPRLARSGSNPGLADCSFSTVLQAML